MGRYKHYSTYNYKIYKQEQRYTPKYPEITMLEVIKLLRERGFYFKTKWPAYYIGFNNGWLMHKAGRVPKCEKKRRIRRKIVIDMEKFEKWCSGRRGVVPDGYIRLVDFADKIGVKYTTFKRALALLKSSKGLTCDKVKVGRYVYYNEQRVRELWFQYKFFNK